MPRKISKQRLQNNDTESPGEFDSSPSLKQEDTPDLVERYIERSNKRTYKKRRDQYGDDSDDSEEGGVTKMEATMMKQLSSGWKKTISSKQKRFEAFSKFCNSETAKVDSIVTKQKPVRNKLFAEYDKNLDTVLKQWETGTNAAKFAEEKINNLLAQKQKYLSEVRLLQDRRVEALGKLHQQYIISRGQLTDAHHEMYDEAKEKRDESIKNLQRKFLLDKKNEEMTSFRKSLESMMFN